jgi:hypothetical protein
MQTRLWRCLAESAFGGSVDSGCQFCIGAVGFDVLTAVGTKMAVFWVVAPCSLVEVYQRFRGPCCLHHHRPDPCVGAFDRKLDSVAVKMVSRLIYFVKK